MKELVKQQKAFEKRLNEINDLKVAAEEFMLEDDKSGFYMITASVMKGFKEVENWAKLNNEAASKYDTYLEEIEIRLNYITKLEEGKTMVQEQRRMHRRMKEMQVQMREEFHMREEAKADNVNCKVKLPKLFITKFNGTHLDRVRFWSQFESDREKSELSPVFSYLKELVFPKVWSLIDGLPFTTKGYTSSKNILVKKYGEHSEVTNVHLQNIMSLPHINNSNLYKIRKFSEKLLSSVQALEIMGKLKEINGYVRLALDKLQGIRTDLVRTDDDWKDWKFP